MNEPQAFKVLGFQPVMEPGQLVMAPLVVTKEFDLFALNEWLNSPGEADNNRFLFLVPVVPGLAMPVAIPLTAAARAMAEALPTERRIQTIGDQTVWITHISR